MQNLSAVQMWSASELRARDLWLDPLTYPEVLQTYENNVMQHHMVQTFEVIHHDRRPRSTSVHLCSPRSL